LGLVALGLSALVACADMMPPGTGFDCTALIDEGKTIVVRYYFGYQRIYRSDDGGVSWVNDEALEQKQDLLGLNCRTPHWPVVLPNDPNVEYSYVQGIGISRTSDQGRTVVQEVQIATVCNALIIPDGVLVIAACQDGIYTRTAEGVWLHSNPAHLDITPTTP
jgi:hypothetical protein